MESSGAPSRSAEEALQNLSDQQVSDSGERVQGAIVSRSLETPLRTSMERAISPVSNAISTRKPGLPLRRTSARIKLSARTQLPQLGLHNTDFTPQCDQAVLTQTLFSEQQREKTSAWRPSSLTKDVPSVSAHRTRSLPVTQVSAWRPSSLTKDVPSVSAHRTRSLPVTQVSAWRPSSLTKDVPSVSAHRTRSLPVTQVASSGLPSVQKNLKVDLSGLNKEDIQKQIQRSFSLPDNIKSSLQQINSFGGLVRVMSANSHSIIDCGSLNYAVEANEATQDEGEDILEEEAICRICLLEFQDGRQVLKMECSCKGELALAHEECAVKWFSIKGNKTCDICKQNVKNLPMTLMRLQNPQTSSVQPPNALWQRQATRNRFCNDLQFLVTFSMLSYICFLELLMTITSKNQASDTGTRTLAISLTLGSVLGFLSSMIAFFVASGSCIWMFAFFQFAVVILCAYIFYHMMKVTALIMVLPSSFVGFGIAVSAHSLFRDYLSQRARWNLWFARQRNVGGHHTNSITNLEIGNMDAPQLQEIRNNAGV